jgi:protocatechuate 3,4-dioxygenase beta subunit
MRRIANDDEQQGHVLTRREILGLLGGPGVLMLAGWPATVASARSLPGCVARPEQTEGPYFVDESLNRSDIRSDPSDGSVKPGTPLDLTFKVSRFSANACEPLPGLLVDVWHCDHLGVYSDVQDPGFNTVGKKFLRGYQVTDARGVARFRTIYPGWYHGRTVHVHFKIRSKPSSTTGVEFISQLYFDDALTDQVHAAPPYASKGKRSQRNSDDRIFSRGGSDLLLAPVRDGEGYAAAFDIALQGV